MFDINFIEIIFCFFISLFFTFLNIQVIHKYLKHYIRSPDGPQKIHQGNVPRLGGVSIFLCVFIISILDSYKDENLLFLYFVISIPIFFLGILEDFTQSISPKLRLIGSVISALMFILIFEKTISSIGIDIIDKFFNYSFFSYLFTILCITYLIQAYNIIDGLNGLSLLTAIISLILFCILSNKLGNPENIKFSIYLIFILAGILIFNFPLGKIFIGDSGAYIIGLYVASLAIIFSGNEVSPYVTVQILIYPAYELLRSFLRRLFNDKKTVLQPDRKHLHSIIHIYNVRKLSISDLHANILSSLEIIGIQILNGIYLYNFYDNELMIIYGIIIFIFTYEFIYKMVSIKIEC